MRQAIETKYLGPTNHRGARVKASCQAHSITLPWDHALGAEDNHKAAARTLIMQLGWDYPKVYGRDRLRWYGGIPTEGNRAAYVFVCAVDYAELAL